MTIENKLRYGFVFWPIGLVLAVFIHGAVVIGVCIAPNITFTYRYCDIHSTHVNEILGLILVVLGTIGWMTIFHGVLPADD